MSQEHTITESVAERVVEKLRELDEYPNVEEPFRSSVDTKSIPLSGKFYDGIHRPAGSSSLLEVRKARGKELYLMRAKHFPIEVDSPVAIFNSEDTAEWALEQLADEYHFLVW